MSQAADIVETKKSVPVAPAQDTREDVTPENDGGSKWVPRWMIDIKQQIGTKVNGMRRSSIEATPSWAVNNASNVLGGMHVATEMLMFKSGVPGNKLIDNPGNPINWVKEPVQKIWRDIYSRGGVTDYSPMTLLRGNPIKNIHKYVADTHDATLRTIGREKVASTVKEFKLGNPWQSRTTLVGLVIWSLSTIIPERKESDKKIEDMAKLRTLHPLQYVGARVKQGLWFPQWNEHKREMLGLGYLGIGVFSGLGAWRNRADLVPELKLTKEMPIAEAEAKLRGHVSNIRAAEKEGQAIAESVLKNVALIEKGLEKGLVLKQGYKFNLPYFLTAVVSFIGGLPLLFALDERKAYSTYGSMVVARLPLLPWSIGSKVWNREDGWGSYLAGKLSFQVEDMLFSLIGGAEKHVKPDGSIEIIDHEKLKKEAIKEAKVEKARMKEDRLYPSVHHITLPSHQEMATKPTTPHTKITDASAPERAMPERLVALEASKDNNASVVG